jgi:hypothetical protein
VSLATGHFGLDFGDGVIYGWHPYRLSGEEIPAMMADIMASGSRFGSIQNDNRLFEAAYADKDITVIEASVLMPEGQFYQVKDFYTTNVDKASQTIKYAFPPMVGSNVSGWGVCTFNCVTYPRYHGVPIPEGFTGQVKHDIEILKTMPGAKPWEPKP